MEPHQQREPAAGFSDWWYGRAGGVAGLVTAVGGGVCLGAIVGALLGMLLQGLPVVPDEQVVVQVTAGIAALLGGAEAVRLWRFARRHGGGADPWDQRRTLR